MEASQHKLTFTATALMVNDLSIAPEKPILDERCTNSLVVGFTPLLDTIRAYNYRAGVEGGGTEANYDCDTDAEKCDLFNLDSGTQYKVTVKACFRPQKVEELCSLPSETLSEWTMPEGIRFFSF